MMGGYHGYETTTKIKVYDPATGAWMSSSAGTTLWDAAATTFRDKVYIIAGRTHATRVEIYSPSEDVSLVDIP